MRVLIKFRLHVHNVEIVNDSISTIGCINPWNRVKEVAWVRSCWLLSDRIWQIPLSFVIIEVHVINICWWLDIIATFLDNFIALGFYRDWRHGRVIKSLIVTLDRMPAHEWHVESNFRVLLVHWRDLSIIGPLDRLTNRPSFLLLLRLRTLHP
jgi:hypothetical protein